MDSQSHQAEWGKLLGPFLLIAVAYLVAATWEIELPGIYMDAVNPDYLVARWLNPNAESIPAWVVPGNDIYGRYPLLIGLHHGSLQLWLGAPLFWLFGMDVVGLRLTHAMFALAVLAAWYGLQRHGSVSRTLAMALGVALAIDPSFVYAFRNQSYITMAPAALLMISVITLLRARTSDGRARILWLAGCGILAGLACWGYFVYVFFIPALLVAAWLLPTDSHGERPPVARILVLGTGLVIGVAPFALGFWLLSRHMGGFSEGLQYYQSVQPRLGVADASMALPEQLAHVNNMLHKVIDNIWHHSLMFKSWEPTPGAALKFFLLISLPTLLWLVAEWQRCATVLLRTLIGLQFSFLLGVLLGAMFFGIRTNAHHYMSFVPLTYAGLAAAMDSFGQVQNRRRKSVRVATAAVVLVLLATNLVGTAREIEALRRTGGIAYFSDAINRLGDDLYAGDHNRLLILPDWGLYMPTAFLTQASMEMSSHEDFALARQRLCEGKDVVVVLITGDRAERFRQWQDELDWTSPQVRAYQQRDGTVVFEQATFSGEDAGDRCPGAAPGASREIPMVKTG